MGTSAENPKKGGKPGMTNPVTQLQKNEQMIFDLRAMYADYGYAPFRIRKFEEYELYVKNKDFIDSANIITFTDTNGKLMALKPDVTLSVVKNSRDLPGQVQKVYYNENIYRVSRRSRMFEELMQVGIECIGDIDDYNIHEVLMLAAMTLQYVSPEGVLVVSDLRRMRDRSGLHESAGPDGPDLRPPGKGAGRSGAAHSGGGGESAGRRRWIGGRTGEAVSVRTGEGCDGSPAAASGCLRG